MAKPDTPYTIEEQNNVIWVTFVRGTRVSPEMIMAAVEDQNRQFDVPNYYEAYDFRGCTPSPVFEYNTMEELVTHIQNSKSLNWSSLLAILVDSDLQFGLCRMFQILANNYQPNIGIFTREADARQWIASIQEVT